MNCFECHSPLHKDNTVGVCQRTPQCKLMYKRRYNEQRYHAAGAAYIEAARFRQVG